MNRFSQEKTKKKIDGLFFSILIFAMVFVMAYFFLLQLNQKTKAEQEKNLNLALNEACVHCYAVEGFYPEDLQYLIDNYGIRYDEEEFLVDYRPVASNLMPEIVVISKQSGGEQ